MVRDGGSISLTGVQVAGGCDSAAGISGRRPMAPVRRASPAARAKVRRRMRGLAASGSAARASRTADHIEAEALGEVALDVEVPLDVGARDTEVAG